MTSPRSPYAAFLKAFRRELSLVGLVGYAMTSPLLGAVPTLGVVPVGNAGFDVLLDGQRVAPIRLAALEVITARSVVATNGGLHLSGLQCRDPLAVGFWETDFVQITLPPSDGPTNPPTAPEPVIRFRLTLTHFNPARWKALFPDGPAPFHFLACSMPTAQVWHQRGWLNATPFADPFPLLQDVHVGSPEISSLWNRNWSYVCPVGAHPIPMIGAWDPAARLYVGYDFQGARASDQSERFLATAYCWQQGTNRSFITLAYPHGGLRYGELVYPQGGETLESWFQLIIDPDLPSTEDPNERFQARLFQRYKNALPAVPDGNDLGWVAGRSRLQDFAGPAGLGLWGTGSETTFYPSNTVLIHGWTGHREMPIDTAVRRGDLAAVTNARTRIEALLTNYAQTVTVAGERCVFWTKPLQGAWHATWGGAPVTTLHNADGFYAARVLVELYRYDRARGQVRTNYLEAIDGLFNWAKHFVWTRNEFADVPSSPFAIGGTLSAAFLLDYYFTFRNDPQRQTNAQLALRLAGNVTWRYLPIWAMDSDRFDGPLDSAFLIEPNSGRDWAGLACANEVAWNIDTLTQVYVHTGDPRMRYYLRGILQRWPVLYRPIYEESLADYGSDAMTEGLGLFDGSGPGRGDRYAYGFSESFPLNEPVGASALRVVAGARACIAFEKNGTGTDVTDYRTTGTGACSFRVTSPRTQPFDVSFSYPYVDVSRLAVSLRRDGQITELGSSSVTRPLHAPSSLYLRQLRDGDVITLGSVATNNAVIPLETPLAFHDGATPPDGRDPFHLIPLAGGEAIFQNWAELGSFAGIVPGERWVHGVPYWQTSHALTNATPLNLTNAHAVLIAYAPGVDQTLTQSPKLVLDDGTVLSLSGLPVEAWRAWPPIFTRVVLLDHGVIPNGRTLREVDPRGTLLMAVTAFRGGVSAWQPVHTALVAAGEAFKRAEAQRLALLALRASYAELPSGRIALVPTKTTAGAAATFAAVTGLRKLWAPITEEQFVDPAVFTAARFPLAFYLGGEHYVKTVSTNGDGKEAIRRYLAGGGTLVLLASEPYPLYYGDGPDGLAGVADPVLPTLGLPIQNAFEQSPPNLRAQLYPTQTVLTSLPSSFDFPPGDPRLRSIPRAQLNATHRYTPILRIIDTQGRDYGDAIGYLELRTGPANGGKILYIWSTLLTGPQGQPILADAVSWLLNGVLRAPRLNAIEALSSSVAVIHFNALPSVDYLLDYRDRFGAGSWLPLQDFLRAPTSRVLRFTNTSTPPSRFYRLLARP